LLLLFFFLISLVVVVGFFTWWTFNLKLINSSFKLWRTGCCCVCVGVRRQKKDNLESEQEQESHHKTEKSHSFRQGETQDGIWEELLFEWWISGIADDEWTEYCSDTSTCEWQERRLSKIGLVRSHELAVRRRSPTDLINLFWFHRNVNVTKY